MYFGSVKFYKHLIYLLIIFTISFTSIILYNLYTEFVYSESYVVQSYYSVNDILKIYGTSSFGFNENQINKVENMIPSEPTLTEMEKGGVYYQELYPDLKCELPVFKQFDEKKAYLTIDDGPTERTLEILDILKEKDVKATFFVVGENTDLNILKRVHDEGHTIGVHSNSHKFEQDIFKFVIWLDGAKQPLIVAESGNAQMLCIHSYLIFNRINRHDGHLPFHMSTSRISPD
jgi:hypothetical protein